MAIILRPLFNSAGAIEGIIGYLNVKKATGITKK
jgi:hypothetical protein